MNPVLPNLSFFKALTAPIGDGVIATDVEGAVTHLNPKAEEISGWPLADAVGVPIEDVFRIINEDTRKAVSNPIRQVLAFGKPVDLANHTLLVDR